VTALFPDRASAECGWTALAARGYKPSDISALVSEQAYNRLFPVEVRPLIEKAIQRAAVAGAAGTIVGGLSAAFVAIGTSLLIPGVGLVAAGPIVAMLAGAGGAIGAIVGVMVGSRVSEKRVRLIAAHVNAGGLVLTVRARSLLDANAIEMDWKKYAVEVIQ